MPVTLTIAEIAPRFPNARIAAVLAQDLAIPPGRSPALDGLIREIEEAARARWGGTELSAIPGVAAWRAAYKGFGIKRTSYRSSVERLIKRVLAGERLPEVNPFVDLYNAVSLDSGLCCGADDLDRILPPLAFRFSRSGDSFIDMGAAEGEDPNDPPKEGEVVFADERHVLCRRWNWRQDARTGITPETRRALVTVQANGWGDAEGAAERLAGLVAEHCGGRCAIELMEAGRPVVEVG